MFDFYLGLPCVYFDVSVVNAKKNSQNAQKKEFSVLVSHKQQSTCRCVNAEIRTLSVLTISHT